MIKISCLPILVRSIFRGLPGIWKGRHLLLLYWFVFMQAIVPGKKTVKEISRWTPFHIPEWRLRRLLKATYWTAEIVITWFAWEAMNSFPQPKDGVLYLVGDSSHKNKRGEKNPVVQKGRENKNGPWFFGIRFVLLAVCWSGFRIPVAVRIILPKNDPDYKKENVLFREMVQSFVPPHWAKTVIVVGDAAYGSRENMKMVIEKNKNDAARNWFFVFAIARTWKTAEGKSIKNMVTCLPRGFFSRTWIPSLSNPNRRKSFWIYGKSVCLRHIGDVTMVLSKKGRNAGPESTKILVTNLPGATGRQVISIYQRRWSVEIIFRELKSGLGLGEHQVTGDKNRVEKSVGIAVIAYLFLLRARKNDVLPGKPWSIFQLQNNLRTEVIKFHFEHLMNSELKKIKNS